MRRCCCLLLLFQCKSVTVITVHCICDPTCGPGLNLSTYRGQCSDVSPQPQKLWHFPFPLGVCFDLRFCLGICSGEKYLLLWDLTPRIGDQTLTYNIHKLRSDGTEEVIPMAKTPRYLLSCSIDSSCFVFSSHDASGPVCWWPPSICNWLWSNLYWYIIYE